jgi:Tetratricopeptide repeat
MKLTTIAALLALTAACRSTVERDPTSGTTPAPLSASSVSPSALAAPSAAPVAALSVAPPASVAPASSASTPERNLFSSEWAKQHRTAADPKAKALEEAAYALYLRHKDGEAVPLYEQALTLAPNGLGYYRYANSLSNVNRLDDAVRAYEIALALEYPHPEVVQYNIACAYSRLNRADEAYRYLEQAVRSGFAAVGKLQTDPDLATLRARPDWAERVARLAPTGPLVGRYLAYGERDSLDDYTICPNGNVYSEDSNGMDESCCGSSLYGKLGQRGDKYIVTWSKQCGKRGTGGRKYDFSGEGCQPHRGCSAEVVCKATSSVVELMKTSDLPQLTRAKAPTGTDPDGEPGNVVFVPATGKPPAICENEGAWLPVPARSGPRTK